MQQQEQMSYQGNHASGSVYDVNRETVEDYQDEY